MNYFRDFSCLRLNNHGKRTCCLPMLRLQCRGVVPDLFLSTMLLSFLHQQWTVLGAQLFVRYPDSFIDSRIRVWDFTHKLCMAYETYSWRA